MRAARIGPTVCELLGPMPIMKRSKTLMAMGMILFANGVAMLPTVAASLTSRSKVRGSWVETRFR